MRSLLALIVFFVSAITALAQLPPGIADRYGAPAAVQNPGGASPAPFTPMASALAPSATPAPLNRPLTPTKLSSEQGQILREYDIRPFTQRIQGNQHPEQAVVDWILRETGYETWHSSIHASLNATRDSLTVYHTPEMQALVSEIVDRFNNSRGQERAFSLRVVTVRNPNWRTKALSLMTPLTVQSPGVQGWLIPRENATLLLAELNRRTDVREYTSADQRVQSGESIVISTMRNRSYTRGLTRVPNAWPGFQPDIGQVEEGAALEFSPLVSLNLDTADAVIKLRMNQVEKLVPVMLDVPSPVANNQRMQIEVPQMSMMNLHERFRWPTDQVLLLSLGVVGAPEGSTGGSFTNMIPGMNSAPRADALLIVEVKNTVTPSVAGQGSTLAPVSTAGRPAGAFTRY